METALLIANSGVQYIRIPNAFTSKVASDFKKRYETDPRTHAHTELTGEEDDEIAAGLRSKCKNANEILGGKSLLRRSRLWSDEDLLPLPMEGGRLWCAVGIKQSRDNLPDPTMQSYDVVFAVDTDFVLDEGAEHQDGIEKVSLNRSLKISSSSPDFWNHPLLLRLYEQVVADVGGCSVAGVEAELFTLCKFLESLQSPPQAQPPTPPFLPTIKVASHVKEQDCRPVDLVIDLGNSRTCAVLIEPSADGPANQWRLKLVPKDRPFTDESMPCPSELAFVAHTFFPFARKDAAGRDLSTFRLLSPIAFGQAARDELKMSSKGIDRRGMSSPKRYVWDSAPRALPWIYSRTDIENPESVTSVALAHIDKKSPEKQPNIGGGEFELVPDHPRSAGIILVILELLEQAYREANSLEYRDRYAHYQTRRRISSVVIMNPSSMASAEIGRLNQLVKRGLDIWRDYRANPVEFFKGRGRVIPCDDRDSAPPQFENPCDEGMSIQACFVYSECSRLFGRRAAVMTDLLGRPRPKRHADGQELPAGSHPSMRVASLDIGGGTIDLSIADYRAAANGAHDAGVANEFHIEQLFQDGFPSAGDDLVKHILESIVFPCLFDQTVTNEGTREAALLAWNRAMSESVNDPQLIGLRKRLVDGVWIPMCHAILNHFESDSVRSFEKTAAEVFSDSLGSPNYLDELDAFLRQPSGKLRQLKVVVSPEQLKDAVTRCWGETLKLTCQVMGEFKCDLLVVGGRSATMPSLKSILELYAPVSPDRIRCLSELEVDRWYPFGENGRVKDAKTAAVVGCGIFYKALSAQLDFHFVQNGGVNPVEQFVGLLNESEHPMKLEADLFANQPGGDSESQLSRAVTSRGAPQWIGVRRVRNERAPSRPIYRVSRTERLESHAVRFPTPNPGEIQFRIRRESPAAEAGVVKARHSDRVQADVEITSGALMYRSGPNRLEQEWTEPPLAVKLQTVIEGTYWLDNGQFAHLRGRIEVD